MNTYGEKHFFPNPGKQIIFLQASWATDKMTTIFTSNGNFDNFECIWSNIIFFSQLDIGHVLNEPTGRNQPKCRGL